MCVHSMTQPFQVHEFYHKEIFIDICQNGNIKQNTVDNSEKLELNTLIRSKFFFAVHMDLYVVI